jgi:para-aminobenzoate synthetase component 1
VHLPDAVAATLLARLPPDAGAVACRRGAHTVVGVAPDVVVTARGAAALRALDDLAPGFWVGWCAFELGHAVERVAPGGASREASGVSADVCFARFRSIARIAADGEVAVVGDGEDRRLLEDAVAAGLDHPVVVETRAAPLSSNAWRSSLSREEYEERVDAVLDLLRAGECYQVNLTRRLTADEPLDAVALYGELVRHHPAPFTAFLRVDCDGSPITVVSASPERYLSRRGRDVTTQPIKGTAPGSAELRGSAKDHAENVMIVDLARNDFGRVCEPGSIRVPSLCAIEAHPGLHHLVSTVHGIVRDDVTVGTLVAATFPPASVTGAPKPRVLQAIESLEPVRRGVYCGAFGWIDTEHDESDLAVAIRTFTLVDDRTELGVGGGIVADSTPDGEWRETELKAARLLAVAGASARTTELVPA